MLKARDWKGSIIGDKGGNIDFIECAWDRKFKQCGDFILYLPLAEYNRLAEMGFKYVENVGRPELGLIQKIEYEKKIKGAFVTLKGFFVDKFLDFAIYRKNVALTTNTAAATKTAITNYVNNANAVVGGVKPIGSIGFSNDSSFPSNVDISIAGGIKAGEALYDILSDSEYGYLTKISKYPQSDTDTLNVSVKVFKGSDLTSGDNAVYFGRAFNNVSDISYTLDESANQCFYEVLQEVSEEHYSAFSTNYFPIKYTETKDGQIHYMIGCYFVWNSNKPEKLGNSNPKAVLTVSLSSDDVDLEDTSTANQQKIRRLLETQAKLDMLNNYRIETISCTVLQEKYEYMKNYDLGDKCVVYIDDLDLSYHAIISEVQETHKRNQVTLKVILGTPKKQKRSR